MMNWKLLIVLLISGSAYSQSSWVKTKFNIERYEPRMLFWDSTSNDFYIGGGIYTVDSKKVHRLFKIDSNENVDYMDTINFNIETPLSMLKYDDTLFYVGYSGLYYLENNSWKTKISDGAFFNLFEYQSELLIGGLFMDAISSFDGIVIKYKNGKFQPFEDVYPLLSDTVSSVGAWVGSFAELDDKLYLAGNFSEDLNGQYNEIISWDGNNWDNMRGGISGSSAFDVINDLIVYKGDLYVAGKFSTSSGSPSNNIIKWDGENWITLGSGIHGNGINVLATHNDELWVFGAIDSVENLNLDGIAIWNGQNWCRPSGSFDKFITCAAEFGETLYVGGNFDSFNGDSSINYIAKLNPNFTKTCGDIVDQRPVGVVKNTIGPKLKIYPNPTGGNVNIELGKLYPEIIVSLFNSQGQLIRTSTFENIDAFKFEINEPKGLYVLKIRTEEGVSIFKVFRD